MTTPLATDSNLHALLIGVDCYLPNQLPGDIYYPSLHGCVRDIDHVQDFLRTRLGVPADHILRLTASNTAGSQPLEPSDQWPTYENMVAAFQKLTAMAQQGDGVYLHYSGHGGRSKTIFPEVKGDNGLDESLVPTDIGKSEARYLRDVEIAQLLQNMVEKGLNVTVVFDSCHSGGATRGAGDLTPRGIQKVDTRPRPKASLVASHEELVNTWRGLRSATRGAEPASGWRIEPTGYTFLAACRDQESAYERIFEGTEKNGALTYWLLNSLKELQPGMTYKVLHDRIVAKVHSAIPNQTPLLEGDGDRTVFGSDRVQSVYAVNVMQVDAGAKRVQLGAGQVQGIRKGARFAVYPLQTPDFSKADQRLAIVQVSDVGSVEAWAEITTTLRPEPIEQGAQAVLLELNNVKFQRGVGIDASVADDQRAVLANALTQGGGGFLKVVSKGEPMDFQVAVEDDEYQIWDGAGLEIPHIRPRLAVADPEAVAKLVQRLLHLTKYKNVLQLANHDSTSPLVGALTVECIGWEDDYEPADGAYPQPFLEPGPPPVVKAGQWVHIRLRNNLQPTSIPEDFSRILNVTILDLMPEWSIQQIYPKPDGFGYARPLDPQASYSLPMKMWLPDGYEEGTDTLKVFATVKTTNFRWLELPPLDQAPKPPEDATREATRGQASDDPLQRLMAAMGAEAALPETRGADLGSTASQEWVTVQIEVRAKR